MIDTDIKHSLSKELSVELTNVNELEQFFSSNIHPFMKKKYLSHLVSTIEDMINNQQKKDFIESLKEVNNPEIDVTLVEKAINRKQLRLFSIILTSLTSTPRKASTRIISGSAIIYYDDRLDEKQIRILIAHELGHIVNNFIFKKTDTEGLASLFAFIALLDKNEFYKVQSKDYIYKSDITILNEITSLCKSSS